MTLKNVFDVPIAAEEHHAHQLIIGTYQAKHRRLTSRGARGTLVNFLCSRALCGARTPDPRVRVAFFIPGTSAIKTPVP